MLDIREKPAGIQFKIWVQPRSSRNSVVGLHGDALKIKLTSPPVDGAANKMCIAYLAKCLGRPKSSLEIVSGHTSRTKLILLKSQKNSGSKDEHAHLQQLILNLVHQTDQQIN